MKRAMCGKLAIGVLLVPLFLPSESAAFLFSSKTHHVDSTKTVRLMARCDQFKLKQVQGAPADTVRTYWFTGVCKIWKVHFTGGKETGKSEESSLWAEARAKWNAQSNELDERVKLTDPGGKHSGDLALVFKCMQNPLLSKTDCVRLKFSNGTDWPGFSVPADKNRPMLAGRTTAAEVDQLTKQAAGTAPAAKPAPAAAARRSPDAAAQTGAVSAAAQTGAVSAAAQASAPAAAATSAQATAATRNPPAVAAVAAVGAGTGSGSASGSRRASAPGTPIADLASGGEVTVSGKYKVPWGGSIAITDADARAAADGICQVAFEHAIRNVGAAPSAASSRRWAIEGQGEGLVAQSPEIGGGGALTRVDTLPLRPGTRKLRLLLDNLEQVAEANESNNLYTLVVTLTGTCGGAQAASSKGRLRLPPPQR